MGYLTIVSGNDQKFRYSQEILKKCEILVKDRNSSQDWKFWS
jgi:hypothetical protein